MQKRAFTLIELLVVIAIIAILAAILFPVFTSAKAAAKKMMDISNFKQIQLAAVMYMDANDSSTPLSNTGGSSGCYGCGAPDSAGRLDKVWGQLVLPYVKSRIVFRSPMDPNATDVGLAVNEYDVPVPQNHPNISYYNLVRTDMGYNNVMLSPWAYANGIYGSRSVTESQIARSADTIMFASSIWDRTATGQPKGGGNWVIDMPCIYDENGNILEPVVNMRPFSSTAADTWMHYSSYGWMVNSPNSWQVFGGMWPWHTPSHVIVGFVDGHVKAMSVSQTAAGCNVRAGWVGRVTDPDKYMWDLR